MLSFKTDVLNLKLMQQMHTKQSNAANSMAKLSSGKRINKASDDAARMSISTRFNSKIKGDYTALKNINDGISLIQTAEKGMHSIVNILQRMRELVLQSGNDTLDYKGKYSIQLEIEQLKNEIESISRNTDFNGINLLGPSKEDIVDYGAMADIVFAVDNTGSMAPLQQSLANNLNTFMNDLIGKGVTDVRFGVLDYYDNSYNMHTFSSGKWTTNTTDVSNELSSMTNSGGIENTNQAVMEAANQYDFRPNDGENQVGHIVFLTNEDGDDAPATTSTVSSIEAQELDVHGVYDYNFQDPYTSGSDDVDELDQLVNGTGGSSVNLGSDNWGSDLSNFLSSAIARSATKDIPFDDTVSLHTGYESENTMEVSLFNAGLSALGVSNVTAGTNSQKENSLNAIDTALDNITSHQAKFGAYMNRLDEMKNQLNESNIAAEQSMSKMVDADMAKESSILTKEQILTKSTIIMMTVNFEVKQSFSQLLLKN